MTWAYRASGRDIPVPSQVDMEQATIIDYPSDDRDGDADEGDWDLARAERLVSDVHRNEQVLFLCVSEPCRRIWETVRGDV